MSNIRLNLKSHIGTRLFFLGQNGTYEIEGDFPLKVGEELTIEDQSRDEVALSRHIGRGYEAEDWEPKPGKYCIIQIDSPTLYRYGNTDIGYFVRLSRKVHLREKETLVS